MSHNENMRAVIPALLLLVLSLGILGYMHVRPVNDKAPMLAVFPMDMDTVEAGLLVSRTGGKIIRAGAMSSSIIVQSNQEDYAQKLKSAGAWLLLDGSDTSTCRKL